MRSGSECCPRGPPVALGGKASKRGSRPSVSDSIEWWIAAAPGISWSSPLRISRRLGQAAFQVSAHESPTVSSEPAWAPLVSSGFALTQSQSKQKLRGRRIRRPCSGTTGTYRSLGWHGVGSGRKRWGGGEEPVPILGRTIRDSVPARYSPIPRLALRGKGSEKEKRPRRRSRPPHNHGVGMEGDFHAVGDRCEPTGNRP